MLKNKKIIIFFLILIILIGLITIYYIKNKPKPFLQDIKLFVIHPATQQLKSVEILTPKDDFLISFKYYKTDIQNKLIIYLQNNNELEKLYEDSIETGENKLCCFSAPAVPGSYKLIFQLANQKFNFPFIVQKKSVNYSLYHLSSHTSIPYPQWQILDTGLINRIMTDIYYSYSKKLSEGLTILLAVQDENNARFIITQRAINNYKDVPFGNIVQDILKQENQALLKAGIINDYTILDQQYADKEIYLKVRNIIQGVSYIILNKSYETTNLLNQKVLISVALTCPEKLIDFYQPIAEYIFQNIQLSNSNK